MHSVPEIGPTQDMPVVPARIHSMERVGGGSTSTRSFANAPRESWGECEK